MTLFRDLLIDKKRRNYYCEVEYLESTGQQDNSSSTNNASYIDTGIIPTTSTKIECRVQFTTLISGNGNEALFGTSESNNPARFAFGYGAVSPFTNFYVGLGNQNLTTSVTRDTNVHTFKIDAVNNSWAIDNTTGTFTSAGTLSSATSIYLFARHVDIYANANKPANAKVYYCQIWDNGVLVRDLIPVLDWSFVPCMYDRVSGQLFYNQGTGDFLYGREIHYVEYLESTGTQYINTGVKLTNNHSVELDYELTNASQSRTGLFGALNMTGSNQGRLGSILSPSNRYLEHGYGSGNDYWQQGLPDTQRHKLYQKKNELYFDGTLVHTFNSATFSLAVNAYLGNFVYTNYTPAKAKYYSSRWWNNDTLVRDYIPAIDSNGVGFMFDRVTHTIYDNAGTGAFKYPAKEIEYLESTGTQYIDMGIKGKSGYDFGYKVIFTRIDSSTTNGIGGEYEYGGGKSCYLGMVRTNGYFAYHYQGTRSPVQIQQMTTNTEYDIEGHLYSGSQYFTINGVQGGNGTLSGDFTSAYNMQLFRINSTSPLYSYIKLKNCWIKDNGVLVRDFIPCYKDGVAGMLDKQNNVFYSNVGTGTFGTGKILESRWF